MLFDPATFVVFLGASIAISITPGPDMTYVFARGLAHGPKAGLISVAGVATGLVVHTTLVSFGLAVVVAQSPVLFDIIRYVGAAYLVWMGIKLLRDRSGYSVSASTDKAAWKALYVEGLIVNLFNPKILLFFLAFLPQFADPARGSVALQIAVLGATLTGCGLIVLSSIAMASGSLRTLLARHPMWMRVQQILTGSLMIGLAAHLLLSGRR
ncbi:MAG: LysE family translocator [Alphaproteobacteria bacterium]|jgi:threonine/homoserine/homoserine lactone efflux protein|nr:LysE family translocator [Rhodospirillaceae bacterium]MDG2480477.1 LysE family translocator [Alphaproteobacteria bacterium]MBT6204289.1 LysE family translocator [Rhodospirillaceae bacterium]MBT6512195.1 LysE family translocator [Rhodospirillaceae bacterium]MBT7615155.1 LysE family translocator [Rhodospirillaceae bacterium]